MVAADRVKTVTGTGTGTGTRTHTREQLSGTRWTAGSLVRDIRQRPIEFGLLAGAALLLILSLFFVYWRITLHAPQYPMGLTVEAYTHKLTGDVREVDGLNHYIGMMQLDDAAQIERAISRFAIPLVALVTLAAFWVRGRWKYLVLAPAIIYPIVFVVDLAAWLYHAGHSLDPHAALSSSIKPFTPRVFGEGTIGQFSTEAAFGPGYYLALLAAILVVAALVRGRYRDAQAR